MKSNSALVRIWIFYIIKRSYLWLRQPLVCLPNHIFLNCYCKPSMYGPICKDFLFTLCYGIPCTTLDFKYKLSGEFWARQAKWDLVKIQNFHFSCWAWSTSWGHILSLKTFVQIPVLSWAIRYSVFQKVKFTSSLQKWAGNVNLNFWHLVVKFGHNRWF